MFSTRSCSESSGAALMFTGADVHRRGVGPEDGRARLSALDEDLRAVAGVVVDLELARCAASPGASGEWHMTPSEVCGVRAAREVGESVSR